ncbi:MAG: energy-coupling factor ABC transporter ATP-binding protein [Candidatus Marinimicrobia bacterium]|nr:energy-coupling factor ABC transporter ATP-binding protein [Candidatus Neomarinimicrobiota bacterium]
MHLKINHLEYQYSNNQNFKLEIEKADVFLDESLGIYGLSGSGKTTLGKIMGGLLKTTAIDFFGAEVLYLPQVAENLLLGTSVRQTLKIISEWKSRTFEENFAMHLQKFGLQLSNIENKHGFELSAGELRIISLSLAFSYETDILVLDEPSIGLDWSARIELIRQLQNFKKPLVLISHDYEMLRKLCARVWIMDRGKLVFQGDFYQLEKNDKLCSETGINFYKNLVKKRKLLLS